jgi:hypothetical protein
MANARQISYFHYLGISGRTTLPPLLQPVPDSLIVQVERYISGIGFIHKVLSQKAYFLVFVGGVCGLNPTVPSYHANSNLDTRQHVTSDHSHLSDRFLLAVLRKVEAVRARLWAAAKFPKPR